MCPILILWGSFIRSVDMLRVELSHLVIDVSKDVEGPDRHLLIFS